MSIIQQLEDLKEWSQNSERYERRLAFRGQLEPEIGGTITPEFDELSDREREYYRKGPWSTREDYSKGQLVQPGPGREGGTVPRTGYQTAGSVGKAVGRSILGKAFNWIGADVGFYYLDKWNEMSKGKSEEEAAAIALDNATLGAYNNKTYIEELKKSAKEKGIDSRAFENVYKMNEKWAKVQKEHQRYQGMIEKLEGMEAGPQRDEALEKMTSRYNEWQEGMDPEIRKWQEGIVDDISISKTGGIASPLELSKARESLTEEDWQKPFIDIQDVALGKLEKEKAAAYDMQSKQVDPEAGNIGEGIQNVWKGLYTYPKYAFDVVNPYSPLPEWGGWKTEEMKEKERIDDMLDFDPKELYRYNKARGLDPDSPLSKEARENLQYEHPGLGMAGGGIAGIRRPWAIPPESGPMPQGLASLNNYATKRTG